MAIVKADGYGHGMIQSARAALDAGVSWLGVTFVEDALKLRAAGLSVPVLCCLPEPAGLAAALTENIDLSASSMSGLELLAATSFLLGRPARIHLRVDIGRRWGSLDKRDWPHLCYLAAARAAEGLLDIVGIWSTLEYCGSGRSLPTTSEQIGRFTDALGVAEGTGLRPRVRHIATSAATLLAPEAHFDMVRPGRSIFGLSPCSEAGTSAELGLRPAMTLRSNVSLAKRVPAGTGVSYMYRYITPSPATLAIVPVGYADGIPRTAANSAVVLLGGRLRKIVGTIGMDQLVVDAKDDVVAAGDEVVLFGPGDSGEPTADDWARALGIANHAVVSLIGTRVHRSYS
jgi:alanine racemase